MIVQTQQILALLCRDSRVSRRLTSRRQTHVMVCIRVNFSSACRVNQVGSVDHCGMPMTKGKMGDHGSSAYVINGR